jgi:hypothetical protein
MAEVVCAEYTHIHTHIVQNTYLYQYKFLVQKTYLHSKLQKKNIYFFTRKYKFLVQKTYLHSKFVLSSSEKCPSADQVYSARLTFQQSDQFLVQITNYIYIRKFLVQNTYLYQKFVRSSSEKM